MKETQTKSFKLKIDSKSLNFDLLDAIKEYQSYYNKLSDWICGNLTETVENSIIGYLDHDKEQAYKEYAVGKKDMLLYEFIRSSAATTGFTQNMNNAIFKTIDTLNVDGYKGGDNNVLGISGTDYRRNGYFKSVISNYMSSLQKVKPKVRSSKITADSNEESIMRNTIYEMVMHNDFNTSDGWEKYLDYITSKSNASLNTIERIKILYAYFSSHEDEVLKRYKELCIDRIKDFNGCKKNEDKKSMSIMSSQSIYTIEQTDWNCGYIMTLSYGKKGNKKSFRLYGNRQLSVYDDNGNRIELTDIINSHNKSLIFTYENGSYYAIVSVDVPFLKSNSEIEESDRVVGIDVNTKHMLLSTSIKDDGSIKEYVNIYKELIEDKDFVDALLNDDELAKSMNYGRATNAYKNDILYIYTQLSKTVTFCPIEAETLYLRILGENKVERAIQKVLDSLQKKYEGVDVYKRDYIAYVKMLRSKISSYFKLYRGYQKAQKRYDIEMQFEDTSTSSAETMDKRRFENPFSNTKQAAEIRMKLSNVEKDITGCRNNIIRYAYDILSRNGYNVVAMENLENSNIKNEYKSIPTTVSLLQYHKWFGKTIEEIKSIDSEEKLYNRHNDKYEFTFDENNSITNIEFSQLGIKTFYRYLIYDIIIKRIHFAEAKDEMIHLSNNGKIKIVLVPSYYSSQMDSINHKLYVEQSENGKTKLVPRYKVRARQEKHINGLNADYNAAKNLEYIVENKEWRDTLCKSESKKEYGNGYSKPIMTSRLKSQYAMLAELKKMNATIDFNTIKNDNMQEKLSVNN